MKINYENLIIEMARNQLNRKDFIKKANIADRTFQNIKNGKMCNPETVGRIAITLGCSIEALTE